METIEPVKNQEINIPEEDLGSNKIDQHRKTSQTAQASPPDIVVISRIVQAMNNYLNTIESDVKIRVNKINGEIIVQAISKETGIIIKTIETGKLLTLNNTISGIIGLLLNAKV